MIKFVFLKEMRDMMMNSDEWESMMRLVDLDKMCADYWDGNYMEIHEDDLKNIKTIIEADKESEE